MYARAVRTTLTLDDDVAALLERVQKEKDLGMKEAVNQALRQGLVQMIEPPRRKPFRVVPFDVGPSLVGPLDDIAEVLALGEGEDYK
jgi:hypothetical protein